MTIRLRSFRYQPRRAQHGGQDQDDRQTARAADLFNDPRFERLGYTPRGCGGVACNSHALLTNKGVS
jgi:hypothetical protein